MNPKTVQTPSRSFCSCFLPGFFLSFYFLLPLLLVTCLFHQPALARLIGVRIMEASAWMAAWVNIQGGLQLKWGLPEKAEMLRTMLKRSEAKTTTTKKNTEKSYTAATAICYCGILAQQPNYSHALIFSFPPLAIVPSCHPLFLFLATFIHVFFSFQAALHVADISRCSHPPQSFTFALCLIFSLISTALLAPTQ